MTADETTAPINDSNGPSSENSQSAPTGSSSNNDQGPSQQQPAAPAQPAAGAQNEPEPVILEEHIVIVGEPAKPKAPAPKLEPAAQEAKPIPPIVVPNPDPNFKPHLAPEMPEHSSSLATPAPAPKIDAPVPVKPSGGYIAQILKTIKLPERRDFKAAADLKKPEQATPVIPKQEEKPAPVPAEAEAALSSTGGEGEPASSIVTPLRTLKDDLQTIVREQKISLVHAVTLEEQKKRGQEHLAPEQQEIRAHRSKRTTGILFASGLLVILGFGALFGIYYVAQQQAAVPAPPQSSIMFAEQVVALSLDNGTPQNLKAELAAMRTKQLGSLGSITRVVPTIMSTSSNGTAQEVPATIQQFFAALGMNPPQELMGAIGPDFFFGFHVVDTNAPLFVIPVTSYDHAFAGMLAWEPTMDQDLSPIFTSVPPTTDVSGVPEQRTFEDNVLLNYDIRELTDDQGNVVLYYSFPTPDILVIAQSTYSFTEILSRLQAAREL